jgi:PAS domain S-box-containing protein
MSTIVLVHENPAAAAPLAGVARARGFSVLEVAGAEEASHALASRKVDAVVLAGADAAQSVEWIAALRADSRHREVVILRLGDRGGRREALDAGADVFMEAPVEPEELAAQLVRLRRLRRESSDRDQTLAEAAKTRGQLEAVFAAMSDGVTVFDMQGNVVLINQAQAQINGFSDPAEMLRNLDFFVGLYELRTLDGAVLPVDQWPAARVMRGESLDGVELRGLRRDTGREWYFQYSGEPVRDADGRQILTIVITRDVTTQKVIEERLIEAKEIAERHRVEQEAIFNSMTEGLVVFDPEGRLLDMNPAALAIHRFKSVDAVRTHLSNMPGFNTLHALDGRLLPLEEWPISRALRGETFNGYEVRVYPTDGSAPWVGSYGGTPVTGPDGKMMVAIVTLRDITAQKQAELTSQRERELFQRILDSIPVMITIYDPGLQAFRFNQAAQQTLGWTEADAADGRLMEKAYPDPALRQEVVAYMESVTPGWREFVVTAKDGALVESSWANIRLPDGTQVGIGIDVRERKQAEAALRASEERFRTYAETMPHLAFIADPEGNVVYSNRRFAEYFGLDQAQARHWAWKHRQRAYHPDDLNRAIEMWGTWLDRGRPFEVEYRLRRHDGVYRWHLTRALPVRDKSGRIEQWVATSTDITEQKQAAEEVVRARDALANANADLEQRIAERTARLRETVAELEHFSYTLTHDLRAPLRAMHGFGELLSRHYAERLDAPGRDYLRRIVQAAGRMDLLITDALNYSKVLQSEFPLEPVDPAALLRGMIDSYPEFQRPHAEITVDGVLPLVEANRAGLTQCFSNLLSNAVKFVTPGTQPRIRVSAEERGNRVRLWFEDNGVGIPPEQQQRIFGMFQRLSAAYPGTGVGLALVLKVVERMRGEVGVESDEGTGSRFWVEFAKASEPH